MSTLTEIRRQTDPALRSVVHQLSNGQIHAALKALDSQGRIHEIAATADRLSAVAKAYVAGSGSTLVIAPDNDSREHLNASIRQELRANGKGLAGPDHPLRVLVARNDLTGEDRAWAGKYQVDDVLRFSKGSKLGVSAGEYGRVTAVDPRANLLTVTKQNGDALTYDARRLQGVSVYRETERPFAVGDRVQFTAPLPSVRVANREIGTVKSLHPSAVRIKLDDDGRVVRLWRDQALHLDHGFATTSHSAQGQTVDRVLLYLDPERAGQPLVNQRLAYVAVSRARSDAMIFCEDKPSAYRALGREYTKETAINVQPQAEQQQDRNMKGVRYSTAGNARAIGHGW